MSHPIRDHPIDVHIDITTFPTLQEAEEAGMHTSNPWSFRVVTSSGRLHRPRCGVLEKAKPGNQLFLSDLNHVFNYLEQKKVAFDQIRCKLCCRDLIDEDGWIHGPMGHEPIWCDRLSDQERMQVFNRLMVNHHDDIRQILDTFSGEVLEGYVGYCSSLTLRRNDHKKVCSA